MSQVVEDIVERLINKGEIPAEKREWAQDELESEMDRHLKMVIRNVARRFTKSILCKAIRI